MISGELIIARQVRSRDRVSGYLACDAELSATDRLVRYRYFVDTALAMRAVGK